MSRRTFEIRLLKAIFHRIARRDLFPVFGIPVFYVIDGAKIVTKDRPGVKSLKAVDFLADILSEAINIL
jgi:hypothetical protein